MPLIQQLALVSETERVDFSWLTRISAALQKQVTRDFAPLWDVRATVDAFGRLEDVPISYWPIIVVEDVQDAAGVHLDKDDQPFALVEFGSSWSLTASHECLEMLADPFGNRLIAGPSPKSDQGRVEFLVEVCDPPESSDFAYTVNGLLVSDFYTPRYFEPEKVAGVRYDFTGAITEPRQVLPGGYLSWHDPVSDHWWQETFFGPQPFFRDLGVLRMNGQSLRAVIDSLTPQTKRLSHLPAETQSLVAAINAGTQVLQSSAGKAQAWRAQIDELKRNAQPIDYNR